MSLPIPTPITPLQPSSTQDLDIRLNQRVSAQVMHVTGTRAVLEINGYPIVARLTSQEQAAELSSRRMANFIITQLTKDEITLKFINSSGDEENQPVQGITKDVVPDISEWLGLEGTEDEINLIRMVLKEKIPVTKELVNQLLEAVHESGIDVAEGIQLAVKLKAAGLPVTTSSLKIASQFQELHLADSFSNMVGDLQDALMQLNKNDPLAKQIQSALDRLEIMLPDLSANEEKLSNCLKEFFRFIGKPYEKLLNDEINSNNGADSHSFNLMDLFHLGKDIRQSGQTKIADGIDHFLELIRQNQFINIKTESSTGKGTWGEVNFVVQWNKAENDQKSDVKFKISFRHDKQPKVIDPQFTNLTLQVDLEPTRKVEFNLSLYQKKINAEISSSDPTVMQVFKDSIPEFEKVLSDLGYSVLKTDIHLQMGDEDQGKDTVKIDGMHHFNVDIVV